METSKYRFNPLLASAPAAALLGITPGHLRKLASRGQVPCVYTPGGHRRYRYQEIMGYLLACDEINGGITGDGVAHGDGMGGQ